LMKNNQTDLALAEFKAKLQDYLLIVEKNQYELVGDLPKPKNFDEKIEVNPYPLYIEATTLSHKLVGRKGSTITPKDAETIVKALINWKAFEYRDQAIELLRLRGSEADLSTAEWKLIENIDKLKERPTVSNLANNLVETTATYKADQKILVSASHSHQNWQELPIVNSFYGRESELTKLSQLIRGVGAKEPPLCQLVAILGMGGIGKTAMCVKLAQGLAVDFEYVMWRSLRNAPLPENFLAECVQFFGNAKAPNALPPLTGVDEQLAWLMRFMQKFRCLLILDNFEAVIQNESASGQYRKGYEAYGHLLRQVGEISHRSCVILTSREKPKGFSHSESNGAGRVLSVRLVGLAQMDSIQILHNKNLVGTRVELTALAAYYSGNPLALMLVAEAIIDLFNGSIERFLQEKRLFFSDLKDLLDQQFSYLSNLERLIIYWLALAREPLSLSSLTRYILAVESIAGLTGQVAIWEALKTLQRRSLIEFIASASTQERHTPLETVETHFTLQNVIMEYVTDRLITQASAEIKAGQLEVLNSHALLLTDLPEYVRASQLRLVVNPIQAVLASFYRRSALLEARLVQLLQQLRSQPLLEQGYASGNLLNLLLCQPQAVPKSARPNSAKALAGLDLSNLNVWHAYLVGQHLPDLNFSDCDLSYSAFTETFDGVMALAFSSDDRYLAMGSVNGQVRLWQVADHKLVFNINAHTKTVRSVSFDHSGTLLATASDEDEIKLWDLNSANPEIYLKVFKGHDSRVWGVAFSPDATRLISGGEDCTLKLWDIATSTCLKTLEGHTDWVRAVAFSPDGKTIISGGGDCIVRIWDAETAECLHLLAGHTGKVRAVAFSPDGHLLISGSEDGTIKLWDWDNRNPQLRHTLAGHTGRIRSIACASGVAAKDSKVVLLVSGGDDQTMRIWDSESGECLQVFRQQEGWIWTVAISTTGKLIASGGEDQIIRLLETQTGRTLRTIQGNSPWLGAVAVSPDGQWLASGGETAVVEIWDLSSTKKYATKKLVGHTNRLRTLAYSPDGQWLASGSEDHTVRLWETHSGKCLHIFSEHFGRIRAVAFNPTGQLLASASEDQTIKLWDVTTKKCLQTLALQSEWVSTVAFSSDGSLLASNGVAQNVRLWEVATGQAVANWEGHQDRVRSVAFSPDGRLLASGSVDHTVRLWQVSTGECIYKLSDHQDRVRSVAFSPDGLWLASGGEDGLVKMWETASGQLQHTLSWQPEKIWSVSFSPDSLNLFSASENGTVQIWEVATGKKLRILQSERPYERMDITGVLGLTETQKASLRALGANERM
jgi:WD40 repeat protein